MKKLLLLFFVLVLFNGCASMYGPNAPVEMRSFEKIIEIPNVTKDEIYVKANSWFVETFNSAESVIEYQDKEAGKIMGKYVFSYTEGLYFYNVKQTISIDIKDNRIRVSIYNPFSMITGDALNGSRSGSYSPLVTQAGVDKARSQWNKLVVSLEESLKTDSDW